MKSKTYKGFYCVVSRKGYYSYDTLRYSKRRSIAAFIEDSALTWPEWKKKYGYDCIKVNATFEPF